MGRGVPLVPSSSESEPTQPESLFPASRMNKPGGFAHRAKCPCCNNPWQLTESSAEQSKAEPAPEAPADTEESTVVCGSCMSSDESKGIDPANFDFSVRPQDDFYLYSNGGWKNANPCPAAHPRWGVFNALNEMNQERLKIILDELEKGTVAEASDPALAPDCKKLIDFHKACMNEAQIEEEGIKPLLPLFQLAQSVSTSNVVEITAEMHKNGVGALFHMNSINDKDDAGHTMGAFSQGDLGLPDRDYYFDADKEEKRNKYQRFLEDAFLLLGEGESGLASYKTLAQARGAAQAVYGFEKKLAASFYTKTELRDVDRTFNKMTLTELNQRVVPKDVSWGTYLTLGVPQQSHGFDFIQYMRCFGMSEEQAGVVNVRTVEPLAAMSGLLRGAVLDGSLGHYFVLHILKNYCEHTSAAFVNLHFEFYKKVMTGAKELKERWKRALGYQQTVLGEAMGKLYVAKFFNAECKAQALTIVEEVRTALRERLSEVVWMSDSTRVEALLKMEKFRVKIGYPDAWIDYAALPITPDSHLRNVLEYSRFDSKRDVARINKPTDRERWFMPPQMVNAYYHPMLNEIVFPAAILQPPFFDMEADDAVQFGGLGCVVGHEMTHGFDDKGRKFDKDGAVRDWWAGDDGKEYERRAAVMVKQASAHEVFGTKLKGELTQGENIADLGGMKLALRALKKRLGEKKHPTINGFSPIQRFFLAWSQVWRQNSTKEHALAMVTLDPHGPSELRCNNTVSNMAEFLEAFKVGPTDPMNKYADGERVDIW